MELFYLFIYLHRSLLTNKKQLNCKVRDLVNFNLLSILCFIYSIC